MCVSITPVSRRRQDTGIVRVHRSGKNCVNKCSFKEIDRELNLVFRLYFMRPWLRRQHLLEDISSSGFSF